MPPKKKPSILIVDPDTHLSDILSKRFLTDGWTVRSTKSVEQAKKLLDRKLSDVVLVDPSKELDPAQALHQLMDITTLGVRECVLYTRDFSRKSLATWKQIEGSVMIRKGEHSLSDFVKKIKKIWTTNQK